MKPKNSPQAEAAPLRLFQSRLDSQINPDHPLCQLAERIDWDRFDDAYSPLYCKDNGTPALPTRLMVAFEYLKYTYNLSDEALVMRWLALKTFTGLIGSISAAKLLPYNAIKMTFLDISVANFVSFVKALFAWITYRLCDLCGKKHFLNHKGRTKFTKTKCLSIDVPQFVA